MGGAWSLTVWGVRGSFPAPQADFLGYGGNTCCLSLDCGDALVVLDAGSGLAALGERIAREKRRRVDILLSHLHLDHVMGLFPFAPRYDRSAEIHLYGAPDFAGELARLIGSSLWPVDLAGGRARILFHEVQGGRPFQLAGGAAPGLAVTALEGSHPGGCFYYRLEDGVRSLAYALDCELSGDMEPRLADFARGADLLVWDASFTARDKKPGWGHAAWEEGQAFGASAGVRRVLMTHYSWEYTDQFIHSQELLAGGSCIVAKEGMVIAL